MTVRRRAILPRDRRSTVDTALTRPAAGHAGEEEQSMIDGKLSLVLPAHNEEENLRPVVERALEILPQHCRDWEIIVVNDGSRDRTGEIAAALEQANPNRVRLVTHSRNRGYGAALTSGFDAATGDYLMFMDSDRQFDIADIERLASFVGRYDIVAGYRIKRNDPWYRFAIGYTFNTIVMVLFGIFLRDIDCGFKIFRAGLLKGMELTSPGALINTEIHAKANRQGASLVEVGVNHYPRLVGEQSGASVRVILRAMLEIIKLWWRMQSYTPPATVSTEEPGGYQGLTLRHIGALAGIALILAGLLARRRKA
jgi:glycosyltransferase involved in cell wall biosynthesis